MFVRKKYGLTYTHAYENVLIKKKKKQFRNFIPHHVCNTKRNVIKIFD